MASGGTRLAGLDLVLHFKQTTKPTGLARQPSDFLWLISKKVTKETICAALGICVCVGAVFLLLVVVVDGAVLRGKKIKGAFSPWATVSMVSSVEE